MPAVKCVSDFISTDCVVSGFMVAERVSRTFTHTHGVQWETMRAAVYRILGKTSRVSLLDDALSSSFHFPESCEDQSHAVCIIESSLEYSLAIYWLNNFKYCCSFF
jgi:hypothetical protein